MADPSATPAVTLVCVQLMYHRELVSYHEAMIGYRQRAPFEEVHTQPPSVHHRHPFGPYCIACWAPIPECTAAARSPVDRPVLLCSSGRPG